MSLILLYLILFVSSWVLTYIIRNHAIKNSLVAEVTERSSHTAPTPHGGGIAIATTWFVGLSALFLVDKIDTSLYYALMIGTIISVVSYLDDLFELSAKIRLVTQALVAILGLYFLGGFEKLDLFFFAIENQIVTNIFAFIMIVWFINLYNFLDGIDGYAGSEAVFLGLGGYLLFGGDHFLVLVASVLGFLIWNWHKAKIFMGDVGSTLLGYNVAVFTIYYANQEAANFWIWIILFSLFWFDATYTLAKRYLNGEKLSQPHKKHIYQRLTQGGETHERVVLLGVLVNCVQLAVLCLVSKIWVSFILAFIVFYALVKIGSREKSFR